jgi:hypothetical protein
LREYLEKHPRPYQQRLQVSNAKLQKDFGIKMSTLEEGLEEVRTQL